MFPAIETDTHDAAPLVTHLHRVVAAAQVHTPEPDDDQLTLTEIFFVEFSTFLVALVLAASVGILIGWGWAEYQNLDLAGLLKALGSLTPAY